MADEPVVEETAAPDEASVGGAPETLHGVLIERDSAFSRNQLVAHPTREQYVDFVRALRDEDSYWLCLDVTAVDYLAFAAPRRLPPGIEPERFEVVVNLIALDRSRVTSAPCTRSGSGAACSSSTTSVSGASLTSASPARPGGRRRRRCRRCGGGARPSGSSRAA